MTERVLSVPPALFLSGLALSVTFGDTSFPFLSRKRHPFPSLSPAVTFLPGRGESVPERGKSVKGRGSGETIHFVLLSGSLPPCQGLSLWESCQGR